MNRLLLVVFVCCSTTVFAQDTLSERFTFHAQATVIMQYKPAFKAKYTNADAYSLQPNEETQTSITSTLFAGARLWKNGSVYFNPEIAGGSGLSSALGVASSTNGETFRVGSAEPKLYVARMYFKQLFSLSKPSTYQSSGLNQLASNMPEKYIAVTIGKVSLGDFFDYNSFSHDPRTHFISWGLMNNGAWDYAANTRGYTPSIVIEYFTKKNEIRCATSMVPTTANGGKMNEKITQANASTFEFVHHYKYKNKDGAIRLLSFFTTTDMGNYAQAMMQTSTPDLTANRMYGRTKYGFCINAEQWLTSSIGLFARAGWNDGKNETWHFTEIDKTLSLGLAGNGLKWKRTADTYGIAMVFSGLSNQHKNYLKAGGKGFILGDGNLNYGLENVTEAYYSVALNKNNIFLTATYQLVINPGYNKDRGPAHVFSVKCHFEI
ncbi:MAG: hypothetical protein RJA07_398 [Bacteroidota bacterium]|jgi:high affinity Mn2+ porin